MTHWKSGSMAVLAWMAVCAGCRDGDTIRPDSGSGAVAAAGGGTSSGAAGSLAGAPTSGAPAAGASAAGSATAGQGGDAGAGGAGAAGGAGGAAAGSTGVGCPGAHGPKMVRISLPGLADFCIDSTEVSQGQYAEFLKAGVDPGKQSLAVCAKKNKDFVPLVNVFPEDWKGCPKGEYDPDNKAGLPVDCVDWCDARAYCEWAGKRLCGAVGGGPLPASSAELTESLDGEWYVACSQGGKQKFPYGEEYAKGKCGEPAVAGMTKSLTPVGSSECSGQSAPFSDVFDLVGNVSEWEDLCPSEGICRLRGGGATVEPGPLGCATAHVAEAINRGIVGVGFRCCADGL